MQLLRQPLGFAVCQLQHLTGKFTLLFNSSSYKPTLDIIELEDGTAYTLIVGLHIMINTHEVSKFIIHQRMHKELS